MQGREGIRQADIIIATSSPECGANLLVRDPGSGLMVHHGLDRRVGGVWSEPRSHGEAGWATRLMTANTMGVVCFAKGGWAQTIFLPAEEKGWFGPLGGSGIFEEGSLVDDAIVLKYVVYDADPLFFFAHQTD